MEDGSCKAAFSLLFSDDLATAKLAFHLLTVNNARGVKSIGNGACYGFKNEVGDEGFEIFCSFHETSTVGNRFIEAVVSGCNVSIDVARRFIAQANRDMVWKGLFRAR